MMEVRGPGGLGAPGGAAALMQASASRTPQLPEQEPAAVEPEAPAVVEPAAKSRKRAAGRKVAAAGGDDPRWRRAGNARLNVEGSAQMSEAVDASGATSPLQVRLPMTLHRNFRMQSGWQGRDMTEVVAAFAGVYNDDPGTFEWLLAEAVRREVTPAQLLREAVEALPEAE